MGDLRVILQARTDSQRLPGKALLPIAGRPSAVLAAQRAGNSGLRILLATSDRSTDDTLATTAEAYDIPVFRGDRDDLLRRFLSATAGMSDSGTVVRLTADNLVPDGPFIGEMLAVFEHSGVEYLEPGMIWDHVPYGLSCEVFRVGALREVARSQPMEGHAHVTTTLRLRSRKDLARSPLYGRSESALRATMDTFTDYDRMCRVFKSVPDPVGISSRDLIALLKDLPDAPITHSPGPELVMGTAQLAHPYGSAGLVHPPDPGTAMKMVRSAVDRGLNEIDTARAYTGSEDLLGRAIRGGWEDRVKITTKLSPLVGMTEKASYEEAGDAAEISVLRSLRALGAGVVPDLLLHRAHHLDAWDGAIIDRLVKLKNEGLIGAIGVSVRDPEEARAAVLNPNITKIQLPLNVLDHRWTMSGSHHLLASREDMVVHVRGVFLQGILLRHPDHWPRIPGVEPELILRRLEKLVGALGRRSVHDLCVAWVRAQPWVHGVVIGMEREDQLNGNLQAFSRPALSVEEARSVVDPLHGMPEALLDPPQWKNFS